MIRSKNITYLNCTSDRCRNGTTKHQLLSYEEIAERSLVGDGWCMCLCCGTLRQHIRNKSKGEQQQDYFR